MSVIIASIILLLIVIFIVIFTYKPSPSPSPSPSPTPTPTPSPTPTPTPSPNPSPNPSPSPSPNPTPNPTPNQLYGVDSNNIYAYVNNNWTIISSSHGFTTITLNDGYIYSVINNDVVYTIPGSSNFTKLDNNNELINVISFDRNKALWGFSSDGKLYTKGILYNSPWIMTLDLSIDKSINIKSFCFDIDNSLYILIDKNIFKLKNNGLVYVSTYSLNNTTINTLHYNYNAQNFYSTNSNMRIVYSVDAINWRAMSVNPQNLYDITFS